MFAKFFKSTRSGQSQDEPLRWIVLDVETTGLDPASDRLLAIAAIAIQIGQGFTKPTIVLGDSYEAVIKQDLASDRDNILIHHIGVGAQESGSPANEVLEQFRQWVGDSPLLAFHAPFDMGMINRAYQYYGLTPLKNEWIDIEPLAAITGGHPKAKALDDWLHFFGLECAVRHQAASDTLVTCELLLRLWGGIKKEASSFQELKNLAKQGAWIPRG
jgi:DNA polymerase III subunit epsilon